MIGYDEGVYLCKVIDQGLQTTKTGKAMLVFKVQPQARLRQSYNATGELVEEQEIPRSSYERTVRLVINEDDARSLEFALTKLRYAGFISDRFEDLDLYGRMVRCECKYGEYNNKPTEDWELALPPRKSEPLKSDNSIARRLNSIFGRELKKTSTVATAAQPVLAGVGAGSPPEDDEIPF